MQLTYSTQITLFFIQYPSKMTYCPILVYSTLLKNSGVPRGGLGCSNPPPEILKALQNRAKLNPIVKTVKNC